METPNEKILKYNNMKKWDVILANPPFDNGLHKQFEAKYFELCKGEIVNISPCKWFMKSYDVQDNKYEKIIRDGINKFYTEIEIVDGNKYFDIIIGDKLSINHINLNIQSNKILFNNKVYDNLSELNSISDDELMLIFQKNILVFNDSLINHIKVNTSMKAGIKNKKQKIVNNNDNVNDWFCVYMAQIRGHNYNGKLDPDFYTLEPKNRGIEKYDPTNSLIIFPFNDEISAHNFLTFIHTDFVRGIIYIYKSDSQVIPSLQYIPWFDFSDPVFSKSPSEIDDYLFTKYIPAVDEETGITRDEIRKHIEGLLPDYYSIRNKN